MTSHTRDLSSKYVALRSERLARKLLDVEKVEKLKELMRFNLDDILLREKKSFLNISSFFPYINVRLGP